MIKKRLRHVFMTLVTAFSLMTSGCVYMVVGGIGALGGYVVSPDTVEGFTAVDEGTLWDTSVRILGIMGTIDEMDEEGGMILATVAASKVSVVMYPQDADTLRVRVKARKAFLPKISVAQEVYVKIMSEVTEY